MAGDVPEDRLEPPGLPSAALVSRLCEDDGQKPHIPDFNHWIGTATGNTQAVGLPMWARANGVGLGGALNAREEDEEDVLTSILRDRSHIEETLRLVSEEPAGDFADTRSLFPTPPQAFLSLSPLSIPQPPQALQPPAFPSHLRHEISGT
ncbi:hypothetical protein COCON_G00207990 [Conger conger]|uniref:Uncharacterized protein n=1 Tax=Conger conger TaxID=82655 RepID=A0A9Q1D0Q4_CONCO|nr:hypothetical protein COCON_G00207990 [Conger conger]